MRVLPWRSESWISSAASIWWTLLVSRSPSRESTERCRPVGVALGDAVMPALLTDLGDLGPRSNGLRSSLLAPASDSSSSASESRDLLREAQRQNSSRGGHRRVPAHDHGCHGRPASGSARASSSMAARPEKTALRNQRGPSTPTNRAGAKTVRPSGPARACGCAARAERAAGLIGGAALRHDRLGDLGADVVPDAHGLGRREGLQLDRRVPEDGGGAHDVSGWSPRPRGAAPCLGAPRPTGHRDRAAHRAVDLAGVVGPVVACRRASSFASPRLRRFLGRCRGSLPVRSMATSLSPPRLGNGGRLRAGLGLLGTLATASEDAHCLVNPRVCCQVSCRTRHCHRAQSPPRGLRERIDLVEVREGHLLDHELGDPVASPDGERLLGVEVHQVHQDSPR